MAARPIDLLEPIVSPWTLETLDTLPLLPIFIVLSCFSFLPWLLRYQLFFLSSLFFVWTEAVLKIGTSLCSSTKPQAIAAHAVQSRD